MKARGAAKQQHGAGHEVATTAQQRHSGPGKPRAAEYDLTRLSVGIWTTRRSHKLFILNDRKAFVLLAALSEQDARKRANSRLGRAWQAAQHKLTDKRNPFSLPPHLSATTTVIALEVLWADLQGMDYINPLHQDGRLVLEARTITKRIFHTMSKARQFYSMPSAGSPAHAPAASITDLEEQGTAADADTSTIIQKDSASHSDLQQGILGSPGRTHRLGHDSQHQGTASTMAAVALQGCSSPSHTSTSMTTGISTAGDDSVLPRVPAVAHCNQDQQLKSATQCNLSRDAAETDAVGASASWHTWATSWVPKLCVSTSVPCSASHSQQEPAASCSGLQASTFSNGPSAGSNAAAYSTDGTHLTVLSDGTGSPSHYVSSSQHPCSPYHLASGSSDQSGCNSPCSAYASPRQSLAGAAGSGELCSESGMCGLKQSPDNAAAVPNTPTNTPHAAGKMMPHTLPDTPFNTPHAGTVHPFGLGSEAAAHMRISPIECGGYLPLQLDHTLEHGMLHELLAQPEQCVSHRPDPASLEAHLQSVPAHVRVTSRFAITPMPSPCTTPQHAQPAGTRKQRSKSLISLTQNISLLSLAYRPATMGGNSQTAGSNADATTPDEKAGKLEDLHQACKHDALAIEYGSVVAVFKGHTVLVTFRDHMLPPMLSRMVKSDVRILKLYESGLPAWAIFLPSYGLWYRPWLRRVTFLLFTAISIISMAMGFYDLYKNVPIVRQAIAALSQKLVFFNGQALLEWLEKHAQIRLSILLTYIFSKSPLFVTLMRLLRTCMTFITQLASPLMQGVHSALAPAFEFCTSTFMFLLQPLAALFSMLGVQLLQLGRALAGLGSAVLGPPLQAAWLLLVALAQAGMSLLQLGKALLWGPMYLCTQAWSSVASLLAQGAANLQWVASAGKATWASLVAAAQAVKGILPAARATGHAVSIAASASTPAASAVAAAAGSSSSAGWWLFTRAGADVAAVLDFMRTSLYRCFRALQAVLNGLLTLALTAIRHRVSLVMQLQRYLLPRKQYLPPAVHHLIQPQPSTPFPTAASSDLSVSLKLQDYSEDASIEDTASSSAFSPTGTSRLGLRHRTGAVSRRVPMHEDGYGRFAPYNLHAGQRGPRSHGGIPLHPGTRAQLRAGAENGKRGQRPEAQPDVVDGHASQAEVALDGVPLQAKLPDMHASVVGNGLVSEHRLPVVRALRYSYSSPGLLRVERGVVTSDSHVHEQPPIHAHDDLETFDSAHDISDDVLAPSIADELNMLTVANLHAKHQHASGLGLQQNKAADAN